MSRDSRNPGSALEFATAEQVWATLERRVSPAGTQRVAVSDAVGRVLAADVACSHDFPPFDRAVMDGYAVTTTSFDRGVARVQVGGLVQAGDDPGGVKRVSRETAMRINTGAPLPRGADAVVMVEKSEPQDNGSVVLRDQPREGQHIERKGAILRQGATIAAKSDRVRPGTIAALVAGGAPEVDCYRRPRVAILSTGNEIVAGGEELAAGQIYDSNSVQLAALVRAAGGDPLTLGGVPDSEDALAAALERGLAGEMLCVVGGMSKGTHDLVPAALERLGVEWLVTSLNLKPGKPTRIGTHAGVGAGGQAPGDARQSWVLGLPGNPVSCAVCFLLFGRVILNGLQGVAPQPGARLRGKLTTDLKPGGGRPMFQPARWSAAADGGAAVTPIAWRGSGDPFGMASANALLYREAHAPAAWTGELVEFLMLEVAE